jgi:hypothetical protein
MKRSQGGFRQPTTVNGIREGQEEEYLDLIIRCILLAGLSWFSYPPDAWTRILLRLKSETHLPSSYEEVLNVSVE